MVSQTVEVVTHVRIDTQELNKKRVFACGIGAVLPEGDQYVFYAEHKLWGKINCPKCLCYLGLMEEPNPVDADD